MEAIACVHKAPCFRLAETLSVSSYTVRAQIESPHTTLSVIHWLFQVFGTSTKDVVLWAELTWHIWWRPSRRIFYSGSLVPLWEVVLARLCVGVNPISKVGKVRLPQCLAFCVLLPSDYHGSVQFVFGQLKTWVQLLSCGAGRFVRVSSRKMRNSKKFCFVWSGFRPVLLLIEVCSDNMLWFAKLSGQFSDGFMVVVPIVGVSTYGIFCFMRYGVLEVGQLLSIWQATVVLNGCFEGTEPLVPFQRITCELINWYLRQTHCVL